ncbi:MAG: cytochrome c [Lysobacteraceae bacterium]
MKIACLFTALALMALTAPVAAMPDLDDDAMAERLAACAACHGARGEGAPGSEYYPHLAGKPAGYLFAQMQGFRDGRRHYPQMIYLMRNWDDAWLARIASFFAAQPMVALQHAAPAAQSDADRARAERLVHEGDPARDLPPCASCHGPQLQGREPGVPALAGLPTDYLIAQLGGWMTGSRHSIAPDCMAQVVSRLDPAEVRRVATFVAGLIPEPETTALEASAEPLPLDCGGATHFDPARGVQP